MDRIFKNFKVIKKTEYTKPMKSRNMQKHYYLNSLN